MSPASDDPATIADPQWHRLLLVSYVFGLLSACLCGCQPNSSNQLLGRWKGRPDTASARSAREAEKYGDRPAEEITLPDADQGSAAKPEELVQVTDWERYDITVLLNFVDTDKLEMSLNEGEQKLAGRWRVIATSPAGCTIEVQTDVEGKSKEEETSKAVRRRFDLIFDQRNDICIGFQLSEVGADRQLGTLYFRRADTTNADNTER